MNRAEQIWVLFRGGKDENEIANMLGIKQSTIRRALRKYKEKHPVDRVPEILLFDIETSPMTVLVWGLYKQKIPSDNVINDWAILSWAAKWLHENEVMSAVVKPLEAKNRQDKSIINQLWALFEKADVIIAHNAKKFDVRKCNARFIINGLNPPMPYQVIDTLTESRKHFAFSSYKLDDINQTLEKNQKIKTTYQLWKQCVGIECDSKQQKQALSDMQRYNENDVVVLEELYLGLLPWIKSHPNVGVFPNATGPVCASCGHTLPEWDKYSYYTTPMGRYRAFRCRCGAINRARLSDISTSERCLLYSSVSR